jgi:predicted enzyme related to lactoylglutathione lyase
MHPHRDAVPIAPRHAFRGLLLAGLVGALVAVPGVAAPVEVPQLLDPPSLEHHAGKVIFAELVTPDIAISKRFYTGLFGWTFRDIQTGSVAYAEATLGGRVVAGLIHRPPPAGQQRQPAWLTFVAVGDADAVTASAVQQGAKVLFAPHNIPKRGREAVLADPQGAVFAVLASSSGDPPDELAANGEWIWSSAIVRDPDTDAAFYQAVFGYEIFELPSSGGGTHLLLASDNYARASVNPLPGTGPEYRPHWLSYVRVENTTAMAAKVVALGGRVLVEPRADRHGGMVAVVADPSGAPFGLLEWTAADSKEVTK